MWMASIMKKSSSQLIPGESKAGAGAAGIGGGTLLVVIANSLKDSNPLKQWFLLAAPSCSIFLSMLGLWLSAKISNYLLDKEFFYTKQKLLKMLEDGIKDNNTRTQHRTRLQEEYEKLQIIEVDRYMKRIESIKTMTEADFQNAQTLRNTEESVPKND
jgi:hypothetical protein